MSNNMKNCLMELKDKILLCKRSIIETINDKKEHMSNRTFTPLLRNKLLIKPLAGLAGYSFFRKSLQI
jgi:hypothetical protein